MVSVLQAEAQLLLFIYHNDARSNKHKKVNTFFVRPITRGNGLEVSWRVSDRSPEGMILGGVRCLVETEVSSAKTEMCDS